MKKYMLLRVLICLFIALFLLGDDLLCRNLECIIPTEVLLGMIGSSSSLSGFQGLGFKFWLFHGDTNFKRVVGNIDFS